MNEKFRARFMFTLPNGFPRIYVTVAPAICAIVLACGAAQALDPALSDPITAQITVSDATGQQIVLDAQVLESLPQTGFITSTQWTEGVTAFTGPTLQSILDLPELRSFQGATITLTASNDYEAVLDLTLLSDQAPIVATRMDGHPMSLRDKGPLWVVFPYDAGEKYRVDSVYAASVWNFTNIRFSR